MALLNIVILVFLLGQIICPVALGADDFALDSPNGGENLKVGSVCKISWHGNMPMIKQLIGIQGGSGYYKIEYSTNGGGTYQLIQESDNLDSTSFNWTVPNALTSKGLVKVTIYSRVQVYPFGQQIHTVATDVSDAVFNITNTIIPPLTKPKLPDLIILAPPSNLAASLNGQKIALTWQDNANNETNFKVERSTGTNGSYAEIASLGPDTISYTDTNVTAFTKYYYRIKAINTLSSSAYSNEVSATTPPLAQPPQQTEPKQPEQPQQPPASQQTIIKFYLGSTDFLVNNQLQTMDASPVSIEGRTMLPVKYVAQPLGASTAWDPAQQKVTVILGTQVIELRVGQNIARVNGQDLLIDPNNPSVKPLILPPGRTMLPLRFIGDNLGCRIDWSPALQEAKLSYPK